MQMRRRLNHDHPCLACDAPWEIVSKPIYVDQLAEPVKWADVSSNCSAQCFLQDVDRYNQGLTDRHARGW